MPFVFTRKYSEEEAARMLKHAANYIIQIGELADQLAAEHTDNPLAIKIISEGAEKLTNDYLQFGGHYAILWHVTNSTLPTSELETVADIWSEIERVARKLRKPEADGEEPAK